VLADERQRLGRVGRIDLPGQPVAREDGLALRPPAHFAELDVELETGRPAAGLDLRAREIELGGARIRYGGLILATGASARRLPELDGRENVFLLRTGGRLGCCGTRSARARASSWSGPA
jgi:NADPH-dependent 2,4-dienoyl-CoA reductase/sulfur reductase-like enzyme